MTSDPKSMIGLRGNAWFLCVVAAVASWQGWLATEIADGSSSLGWIETGYRLPVLAIACGIFAFVLIAASPWRPILGAIAITWAGFGIARETPQIEWTWESGFQTTLVALATLGTLQNQEFRESLRLLWKQGAVWLRLVLALLLWTVTTELVARLGHLEAGPKHHVFRMFESVAVMALIAVFVRRPRELVILLGTAVLAVFSTTLQRANLEGAHDIAFAAAPLACLTLGVAFQSSLQWLLLGLFTSMGLALVSIATANRGANVGLVVGGAALLVFGLGRAQTLVSTIAILSVAGFAAFQSPLRPRIEEWIENGWETATLASRVEFWKATIDSTPQQLLFGIGPGRGGQAMSEHLELTKWKATHSSPLEMFSEQGVVGLLLWLGLLALALYSCGVAARSKERWVQGLAVGVTCGLLAMLVAGLAVSRHDDIRMFWMIGLAFAAGSASTRTEVQ